MPPKDKDRLPPDQLVDEVARKGDKSGVPDETVRREATKNRETSPTGAPKEHKPGNPCSAPDGAASDRRGAKQRQHAMQPDHPWGS